MLVHVGANSLKKPHHIVILRFSEVVKGHANYFKNRGIHLKIDYDYPIFLHLAGKITINFYLNLCKL